MAFVDIDDWIKKYSLGDVYREAVRFRADIVMGEMEFGHANGSMDYYKPVPKEMMYTTYTGKEAFIQFMKTGSYRPMTCNYIYRRAFLEEIQARFMVDITIHEDELWTPVVLCQASRMVIIDTGYYYYRQRDESAVYVTNTKRHINNYIFVTNLLFGFTDRYDYTGADAELKSWMYVNVLNRLQYTFSLFSKTKDTSYIMPSHQLDRYRKECSEMPPEPQKKCDYYYRLAEKWLKIDTELCKSV